LYDKSSIMYFYTAGTLYKNLHIVTREPLQHATATTCHRDPAGYTAGDAIAGHAAE
jgi:hypothetical protein